MERERPPIFSITCDAHGHIGIAHSLDEAFQLSSDHKYDHPLCESYLDDSGVQQKHVHIIDTKGNVWS